MGDPPGDTRRWEIKYNQGIQEDRRSTRGYKKMGDPPGDTRRWEIQYNQGIQEDGRSSITRDIRKWEIHQWIQEDGRSSITRGYKKMGDLV